MEYLQEESESLMETVAAANELFSHGKLTKKHAECAVKSTQEAALDAKLLLHTAHLGSERAQKLKVERGSFDLHEFIGHVRDRLESGSTPRGLNWSSVSKQVARALAQSACPSFMYCFEIL